MPKLNIHVTRPEKELPCNPGDCVVVDKDVYMIVVVSLCDWRLISLEDGNRFCEQNFYQSDRKEIVEKFCPELYKEVIYIPGKNCTITIT